MKRLVVLSSRGLLGRINDPIHRGFLEAFPGEVVWIGPGERRRPAKDLARQIDALRPSLVVVNMKKRVQEWVQPEQLAAIAAPTAMLEVDYCYEDSDAWYEAAEFDLVLLRGKSDVLRTSLPNARWCPFSAHSDWLCPPTGFDARPYDVGFAGTVDPVSNYPARARAIELLAPLGIKAMPKGSVRGLDYMHWWRKTRVGLTCSSVYRYENAKHVIIPAAGALLLTDGSPGLPELLPSEAYALYRTDGSDVAQVVTELLADPEALRRRRRLGQDHIASQHRHDIRWRQVLGALGLGADDAASPLRRAIAS